MHKDTLRIYCSIDTNLVEDMQSDFYLLKNLQLIDKNLEFVRIDCYPLRGY